MTIMGKFGLIVIALLLATGCTLEKRIYRNGYYYQSNTGVGMTRQQNNNNRTVDSGTLNPDQTGTIVNSIAPNISATQQQEERQENRENVEIDYLYTPKSADGEVVARESVNSPLDTLRNKKLGANLPSAEDYGLAEDAPRVTGFAIAALVLGIISLFATFFGAIVCGILAMVFGIIALYKIKKQPEKWKGRGMALAGYICAVVGLTLWSVVFLLYW